jgi:hypothetical protein
MMNNVHDDEPVVFHTRWALSYLRGPLTRSQVEQLMAAKRAERQAAAGTEKISKAATPASQRPVIPPGIEERFLAPMPGVRLDESVVFRPALYSVAQVHFVKASQDLDQWETVALLAPIGKSIPDDIWQEASIVDAEDMVLESEWDGEGRFGRPAAELTRAKNYTTWRKELKNHVYRNHTLKFFSCASVKEKSRPGESESDFRVRLKQAAFEVRDLKIENLRKKYAPKLKTLTDRVRRYEQKVEQQKEQLKQQSWKTALSFGTTVLGAMLGRKLTSATNVSRAATSMRSAGRIASEKGDIDRANESLEAVQEQFIELEEEFNTETATLREEFSVDNLEIEEVPIRPRKADLNVPEVVLVWTPWTVDSNGIAERAF